MRPVFYLAVCCSFVARAIADCNITCPVGNYKSQLNTFSNATCSACPPGTYSTSPSKAMTCPPCPVNSYCITGDAVLPCPSYTHSTSGSSSVLQCRCDSGYACSYSKRIFATVVLNSTVTDFNSNYNNIKSDFINSLAFAAGVSPADVVIDGVIGQAVGARRRILSLSNIQELTSSIHVKVHIERAERLMNLDTVISRVNPILHISHRWIEAHDVSTKKDIF